MRYPHFIFPLLFLSLSSVACSGGNTPVTPLPEFTQVSSYDQVPQDFSVTYEIRDEFFDPPYRQVLAFTKNGELTFEQTWVEGDGYNRTTEYGMIPPDEILTFYNFMVAKGYFNMNGLYTVPTPVVPIETIETTAKSTEKRVEYHTCPTATNPEPLPKEFIEIVNRIKHLASEYIDQ